MTSKVVVYAIILVTTMCLVVSVIEMIVPLSVKAEMDTSCRNALLSMEINGGLTENHRLDLNNKLRETGFTEICINGTESAKFGEEICIRVEATYNYSRLISLFDRSVIGQKMKYERVSISRRVMN
ncbi:MAG: hypothetical protein PHV32_10435 [Eubacteriales bacterium]|nr:hypothetical protein [Eubacteriales bacterium]